MPLIAYGQNFEDVLLNRCFADQETGFYVDVGAWHPTNENVTKIFYDRGWHGVNVEPVPTYWKMLEGDRVRDTNLQLAVGDKAGTLELTVFEGSGGSSFDDRFVQSFAAAGFAPTKIQVKTATLTEIFEQYVPRGTNVDFLKIDVEGWEDRVVAGMDWKRFRPRVVLIEATLPNSWTPNWEAWEPSLIAQGYRQVWFDGLNRWYLADEAYESLKQHFNRPPCIHDNFITAPHAAALEYVRAAWDKKTLDPSTLPHANALAILQWKEIEAARHELAWYKSHTPFKLLKALLGKKLTDRKWNSIG
ncbi:FkbM family methyltransferase [Roseiterribacter gracilis]|uniref:Methyltransferase FkbM domain-containing protein n=1 Tax=Roseiterribacter gracilis TaxID=2812848 RepID=A0A8S8XDZ6_9PROT|nr:hypothetical protein TMPK1_23180 [Rhodospirillales bacterium TMPK1]